MADVMRTITILATSLTAARSVIANAKDGDGQPYPWSSTASTSFLGRLTPLPSSGIPVYRMMSGWVPPELAALFDAGGPGALLVFDLDLSVSVNAASLAILRLGLYPVVDEI